MERYVLSFQSPNAVQLERGRVSLSARLILGAGRALPFVIVAATALVVAAITAREGASLGGALCVFLGVAPLLYLLGKLAGFGLKLTGLLREGANRKLPQREVQIGVGPQVQLTVGDAFEVRVGELVTRVEWRSVTLPLRRASVVLALGHGRMVTLPNQAFEGTDARERFVAEIRARVSTFIDVSANEK